MSKEVDNDEKNYGLWPEKNEAIFAELMDKEVSKGNRPTNASTETYVVEILVVHFLIQRA